MKEKQMVRIKILVLAIIMVGCLILMIGCRKKAEATSIRISTDSRVELMSLIFRLAKNPEYNQGRIKSYNDDADKHFASFEEQDVVKMARKLRESRGVSYDAVMKMAVHVTDAFSLNERIPFDPQPETLDKRWTPENAREFLKVARRFVKKSDFEGFIKAHTDLYDLAATRMQAVMEEHGVLDWFNDFFGDRPGARFELILGMLNGPASYGARIKLSEKDEILYCVLGVWDTDDQGQPEFSERVLPTVVHEFCHSYCNPLVDKHAADLEASAKPIFALVEETMRGMAYASWQTMMRESLVRASVIRYMLAKQGEEAARKHIETEKERKFFWMDGLVDLLNEYEQNRETYPRMDDFFPEIVAFFEDYVQRIDDDVKAYQEEQRKKMEELKAKSPKIVSMIPVNGSQDVDPDLKAIVVTFDRPMNKTSYAVMRFSDKFPEKAGKAGFDESGKVFTIPVKLEPDREYELGLNAENFFAFQSEKKEILYPVVIRFKTRKK